MAVAPSGNNLCYLVGTPRAGTTLLSFLLDQHPAVCAPAEPWLMFAIEAFGRVPARHPAECDMIGQAVDEYLGGLDRSRVLAAMAAAAYGAKLEQTGARVFVDKTPRYYQILDFLESAFPEARFLVLLRNPFAVLASLKSTWGHEPGADWRSGGEPQFRAFDLALGFRRIRDLIRRRQGDPRVMVVRYEALVEDSAGTMAGVQDFLGLEAAVDPAAVDFAGAYAGSFMGDKKIRSAKGVHRGSLDSWRSLPAAELQAGYDLLGSELLRELGYGAALEQAVGLGVAERPAAVSEAVAREVEALYARRRADLDRVARSAAPVVPLKAACDLAYAAPETVIAADAHIRALIEAQGRFATQFDAAHRLFAERMAEQAHHLAGLETSFAEQLSAYRALVEQANRDLDGLHRSYTAQIEQHRDIIAGLNARTGELSLALEQARSAAALAQAEAAAAGQRAAAAEAAAAGLEDERKRILASRLVRACLGLRGLPGR